MKFGDRRLPGRFWSKVSIDDSGCWRWTGGMNGKGYGTYWMEGATRKAHRIAYEFLVGPIPPGHEIDHVRALGCRYRDCVNPAHLEPVTGAENIARSPKEPLRDSCVRGHPFDEPNTHLQPRPGRNPIRVCRTCRRQRKRCSAAARSIPLDP